jgi:hypothetical protein
MIRGSVSRVAVACMLLVFAGCASPGFLKWSKSEFPKTGPKNPVARILGLWEPAEGMAMGKSCRGFSAQIMFFGQAGDVPAQVDGDVRIYVFDDQGTEEERALPIHQFDYPASTWNAFLTKGPLGATYPVFVPYTRPGVHEAKCSLRIRYTSKNGIPAYSDMVNVVLPGVRKVKEEPHFEQTPSLGGLKTNGQPHPGAVSQNPQPARNLLESLPTQREIQEQLQPKRPHAVELNELERDRIMREATARLQAKDGSRVALAEHEEFEPERTPRGRNSESRRIRRVSAEDEDKDNFLEDVDDEEVARPARRRAAITPEDDFLEE